MIANAYADMIYMQRPISRRIRMDIGHRAKQFAPFAALTGYDEVIRETARLTDKKIELEEGQKEILNNKLLYILENII